MGDTLVSWLSGFWAQTGSVANWKYVTFVRLLGEAAAPEGGGCGPGPDFPLYILASSLQQRKNHGKPSVRESKGAGLISAERDSFSRLGHRRARASTGLLAPDALDFRVRWQGQPSVSVGICRLAKLGGSPCQLTLSQSSQSGLWCGRWIVEHPDPRESTCY